MAPGPVAPIDHVAAIVVTRNRAATLERTLSAITTQVPPAHVYVADNASTDGTIAVIAAHGCHHLAMGDNLGYAAGLAAGMAAAGSDGSHAWFWLMDDDSHPAPGALATLLAAADDRTVVALGGGRLRHGVPIHDERIRGEVDFVLVDGALIPRTAVAAAGHPRASFFMGFEDIEYSRRLTDAGFRLVVVPGELIERLHLGSVVSQPWRGYYQARNHLRVAIEHRSPVEVLGWLRRETGIMAVAARRRRWRAIGLRVRGAIDGARGREGRRVDP